MHQGPQTESGSAHALTIDAAMARFESRETGLGGPEAEVRARRDGPNAITSRESGGVARKLIAQLAQPLVVVLIAAAVLSAVLGDLVDALVIACVVMVNAVIGFVQESRAERAIAALGKTIVTEATVLRDGVLGRLPSEQLVVGDVVALSSGDTVPADLRLFAVKDLQIEEAALTGESVPVSKATEPLAAETPLADRRNQAFAGSLVTYGQGRGVVVAIGDRTEAGRIAGLMARTRAVETPLTRRIGQMSRLLVWIILAVAVALFAVEVLRGRAVADTFNAAVALAVGAIPEGLPAAVTILLAVGVSAMAKRRAVVRRLPAVETLGSTTVICSDKTGTLTENQMTVTAIVAGGRELAVSGVGYDTVGTFRDGGELVDPAASEALCECLRAGALCNDSRLVGHPGAMVVEGDPTEAALTVAARKAGLDEAALAGWRRLDVVPFESQHMLMATLNETPGGAMMYVKGSSEALLERCVAALDAEGTELSFDAAAVHREVDALADRGMRVLVLARRRMPGATEIGHGDVTRLTFLGLAAMIDPPRPEAKRAVAACRAAGIQVKMITGDHGVTASVIADELGLEGARTADGRLRAVTGRELAEVPGAALPGLVEEVAVFARVAPEQKLLLVRALQGSGHVVAMTGDGVNDAPALKQADIGIGMGRGGTDVARAASAMILTDDNFATIEAAVEEGRAVYDNLRKFIAWTLPTNGAEATVLLIAMALGASLPVLPVQLLWVNMVTAVLLGTALVFEPREPGLMARKPRRTDEPILDRRLGLRTLVVSAVVGAFAYGLFALAHSRGVGEAQARTIAVNTIVVAEVGYLFACRSLTLPLWRLGFFGNRWVWFGAIAMLMTQLAFTYHPFMNRVLHTAPIAAWWWVVITGVGLVVYLGAELKKVALAWLGRHAHAIERRPQPRPRAFAST